MIFLVLFDIPWVTEKSSIAILCNFTILCATKRITTELLFASISPAPLFPHTIMNTGEASVCLRLSDGAHNCFSLSPLASELWCKRWMVCHTLNELNPLKSTVFAIWINEQRENTQIASPTNYCGQISLCKLCVFLCVPSDRVYAWPCDSASENCLYEHVCVCVCVVVMHEYIFRWAGKLMECCSTLA